MVADLTSYDPKAVVLDLMQPDRPEGGLSAFVGRHGAIKPAGKARCNMPIGPMRVKAKAPTGDGDAGRGYADGGLGWGPSGSHFSMRGLNFSKRLWGRWRGAVPEQWWRPAAQGHTTLLLAVAPRRRDHISFRKAKRDADARRIGGHPSCGISQW
jgi:hypothetical protein